MIEKRALLKCAYYFMCIDGSLEIFIICREIPPSSWRRLWEISCKLAYVTTKMLLINEKNQLFLVSYLIDYGSNLNWITFQIEVGIFPVANSNHFYFYNFSFYIPEGLRISLKFFGLYWRWVVVDWDALIRAGKLLVIKNYNIWGGAHYINSENWIVQFFKRNPKVR